MKKFVKDTSKKLATGALAILATIGGSSFGVGAASPNGTINVSGSGAAWTSGNDFQLSGVQANNHGTIPVSGYQTSKVYNYELNIAWGDMKFVFDRGVYNTSTNQLTKKVTGGTNNVWDWCEANAVANGAAATTGQGVGKWCGFDGRNNRVTVQNQGNGNVRLNVECNESSVSSAPMASQGIDMQLAFPDNAYGDSVEHLNDQWVLSSNADGDYYVAPMNTGDAEMDYYDTTGAPEAGTPGNKIVDMKIAKNSNQVGTIVLQKKFNLDGSPVNDSEQAFSGQDNERLVKFYLNITGTPDQGEDENYLRTLDDAAPSDSTNWEQIGTIDLSFTPMGDTPQTTEPDNVFVSSEQP